LVYFSKQAQFVQFDDVMALISSRRLQIGESDRQACNSPGEAIGVSEKPRISYFNPNYEIEKRGFNSR
jgi:hypothetical protein